MITPNESGSYLSSVVLEDYFLEADALENSALMDFESGPSALNDPEDGLFYQIWTCRYYTDTEEFVATAPNTPATIIHSAPNVTELSFSFDQNANPFITYVEDGQAKFWWFDTVLGDTVISNLPAGSITPRCSHDDKRQTQSGNSDILLCYALDDDLKMRIERDRYTVEYILKSPFLHPTTGNPASLVRFGMNRGNRLQWLCTDPTVNEWSG